MGGNEGKVFTILLLKIKPISIGLIYEPSNNNFIACVEKHMDDNKFHNEVLFAQEFQ